MGTANFCYNDTLYALDNSDDEFLFDDTVTNIKYSLDQFKNKYDHAKVIFDGENYDSSNRSYGGLIVVDCWADVYLEDIVGDEPISFTVEQKIILRGGYYAGFNLDRHFEDEYNQLESLSDINEDWREICEERLDIDDYFEEDEDLLDEYLERIVKVKFESAIEEIEKEFDDIYHTLGKQFFSEYGVTAQFSNGETIYHKVNNEKENV